MYLGQPTLEAILRSHIEKYGCSVELSFEDDGERVLAKLVKRKDGEETHETFESSYLVGADGAKGVTRKLLGLTFLGENYSCLIGDLCLEIEGVDRRHRHIFGDRSSNFFTLRPTEEIAPDGFQFMITMRNYEPQQLLADQKLMVRCMSELTGHDINVRKAAALSVFRPNIRMADKFGSGRVFIVGGATTAPFLVHSYILLPTQHTSTRQLVAKV
ncbi:FAD-binding monooxygenase [Boletus reticuloceps]|uniref:FAD-binding monooxygenase n=1 Tax=Boletus reticuloceps TaxID=495285 RepID=A0A8I3ACF4_9AGAM|nr:FAD-binding monooxygenase [Boletus reticuloceps]